MAEDSAMYHEPLELVPQKTRELHRAIVSVIEELQAIDWYAQRAEATEDPELRLTSAGSEAACHFSEEITDTRVADAASIAAKAALVADIYDVDDDDEVDADTPVAEAT